MGINLIRGFTTRVRQNRTVHFDTAGTINGNCAIARLERSSTGRGREINSFH